MQQKKSARKKKKTRSEIRSEATRQAMLDASREVFAEKGLDSTTIDDITDRADVGKGTFYYYFENKEEVVQELISNMMKELCQEIDTRCKKARDLELFLGELINAHLTFFANRWDDFVLYYQGRADLTLKEGYKGIDKPVLQYLEHIADLLDAVVSQHLDDNTLTRIACAVAGFVSGYFSFAVIAYEEEELEEILRPVRSSLVAGLRRFINESISKQQKQ